MIDCSVEEKGKRKKRGINSKHDTSSVGEGGASVMVALLISRLTEATGL